MTWRVREEAAMSDTCAICKETYNREGAIVHKVDCPFHVAESSTQQAPEPRCTCEWWLCSQPGCGEYHHKIGPTCTVHGKFLPKHVIVPAAQQAVAGDAKLEALLDDVAIHRPVTVKEIRAELAALKSSQQRQIDALEAELKLYKPSTDCQIGGTK